MSNIFDLESKDYYLCVHVFLFLVGTLRGSVLIY